MTMCSMIVTASKKRKRKTRALRVQKSDDLVCSCVQEGNLTGLCAVVKTVLGLCGDENNCEADDRECAQESTATARVCAQKSTSGAGVHAQRGMRGAGVHTRPCGAVQAEESGRDYGTCGALWLGWRCAKMPENH